MKWDHLGRTDREVHQADLANLEGVVMMDLLDPKDLQDQRELVVMMACRDCLDPKATRVPKDHKGQLERKANKGIGEITENLDPVEYREKGVTLENLDYEDPPVFEDRLDHLESEATLDHVALRVILE